MHLCTVQYHPQTSRQHARSCNAVNGSCANRRSHLTTAVAGHEKIDGFVNHRKLVHSQSCTSRAATRKPNPSLMPMALLSVCHNLSVNILSNFHQTNEIPWQPYGKAGRTFLTDGPSGLQGNTCEASKKAVLVPTSSPKHAAFVSLKHTAFVAT
jgi:hypothetical protein